MCNYLFLTEHTSSDLCNVRSICHDVKRIDKASQSMQQLTNAEACKRDARESSTCVQRLMG